MIEYLQTCDTPVTQADVEALAPRLGRVIFNDDQIWGLLRRLLAERDELRERAEKAEAAQADERGARAVDLARLSKAEANSGVAMLRRLREEFQREKESKAREAKYARDDAKCDAYEDAMREQATLIGDLMGRIDRMLAEAEKPAETVEHSIESVVVDCDEGDGCPKDDPDCYGPDDGSHEACERPSESEPCRKQPKRAPTDAERDTPKDVLDWANAYSKERWPDPATPRMQQMVAVAEFVLDVHHRQAKLTDAERDREIEAWTYDLSLFKSSDGDHYEMSPEQHQRAVAMMRSSPALEKPESDRIRELKQRAEIEKKAREKSEAANKRLRKKKARLRSKLEDANLAEDHLRRCLVCIEELAEGTADPTGYEAEEIQPAAEAIYGLRRAVTAAVEGQRRRTVIAIVMGLVGAVIGANVAWGLA